MTASSQHALREKLRAYCVAHRGAVLYDPTTDTLFDVFSAKTLPLGPTSIAAVEERIDRETKTPYLAIELSEGRQLALTQAGVAFPPDFRNSGPVSLPLAVCFRDFRTLVDRVKHELYGHAGRPPTSDTPQVVMMAIAILDGARAQGFEVEREERELDLHLNELEKRRVTKA